MSLYYYYCKMQTFESMLRTKTFWLTDLTKSNDSEEVLRAYRNLWDRVARRLEDTDLDEKILTSQLEQLRSVFAVQSVADVPYGCCFCSESDLVQQWREYGDSGKGVSIGFDLDCINGLSKQYPITSTNITHSIGYEAVIYDSLFVEDSMFEICYNSIQQYGYQAWIMEILPTFKHYAGFVKNPTFRDEKETRIVFYPSDYFTNSIPELGPLETNIVPHYSLSWADGGSSAMRSVKIGYDNPRSIAEIQRMILDAGINDDIQISKSECTYRTRQHNEGR